MNDDGQKGNMPTQTLTEVLDRVETRTNTLRPSITDAQRAVYHMLRHFGPLTDEAILVLYDPARRVILDRGYRYPEQTPSGLRTRRSELVRKGYVADTGETVRTLNGIPAAVWRAI